MYFFALGVAGLFALSSLIGKVGNLVDSDQNDQVDQVGDIKTYLLIFAAGIAACYLYRKKKWYGPFIKFTITYYKII